jgi:phenylacetate-CoA ligase
MIWLFQVGAREFINVLGMVTKMISRNLFILAHQIGDRNFYPIYKKLVKNQWKSYEELKEEQGKQLSVMINFAYKNVPYYHNLFDDLKLSPDDIKKVDDLEKLPILTKDIIKQNWEEICHIRGDK